jgi:hypothetical protein
METVMEIVGYICFAIIFVIVCAFIYAVGNRR